MEFRVCMHIPRGPAVKDLEQHAKYLVNHYFPRHKAGWEVLDIKCVKSFPEMLYSALASEECRSDPERLSESCDLKAECNWSKWPTDSQLTRSVPGSSFPSSMHVAYTGPVYDYPQNALRV
jgi:hypothetical protein